MKRFRDFKLGTKMNIKIFAALIAFIAAAYVFITVLMVNAVVVLACSVVLFLAFMLILIKTSVTNPVNEIASFAKALASGNFDVAIKIKSLNEIGLLKSIMDTEVRQAFINIEHSHIVSEKRAKYQTEQVNAVLLNLERLSRGKLSSDLQVLPPDEDTRDLYDLFSQISDNLYKSINAFKSYIREIADILGNMAKGDLSAEIVSEYQGDFIELKESINTIIRALNAVLKDINTAADQVTSGSRQVSEGNQIVSQGTMQQASSIDGLFSSITQIAEQTKRNAVNANKANELSALAKNSAADGNEQMQALQKAMAEINQSSESISKIIKVVEDIAFQTNILAINAAVEAAKAGVHGRSFAVVAEEVRNLAAKSANAAKETADLIQTSIRKTEIGENVVNSTAEALAKIAACVEDAGRLVEHIAAASNEQAAGVVNINRGIEELHQVVQSNSAIAEEGAAASEELSSQAELLKSKVAQFTLTANDNRNAAPMGY